MQVMVLELENILSSLVGGEGGREAGSRGQLSLTTSFTFFYLVCHP